MDYQEKLIVCVCLIYWIAVFSAITVAYYGISPYVVTVSDIVSGSSSISFTLHIFFRHYNGSVYVTGLVLNDTVMVMPYFTLLAPGDTLRLTVPGNYTGPVHFSLMLLSPDVQHIYSIPFVVNAQIKNGTIS